MHIRVFGALGSNVLREARRTPTAWTWTKMAFRFRFPAKGDLCGKDKSSENSVFQTVQGFQQIPSLTGLVVLPHSLFRNSRRSAAASAIARLFKDRSAATAVEFALISIPFFTLLFGIIELGLMFTLNVSLDSAIANFATQVRTGQVQAPGSAATSSSGAQMDLSGAKNAICNNIKLVPLSTCLSQLQLDVRAAFNLSKQQFACAHQRQHV